MNGSAKLVSAFMVLWMLALQLLLAQHYTVHFNENVHGLTQHLTKGAGDHLRKDRHDENDPDDICQVCAFSKSLSHSLGVMIIALLPAFFIFCEVMAILSVALSFRTPRTYSARAPPALS